jgi:methyl-accepting chemotaxis protein
MWKKEVVDEILEHINAIRTNMAEMQLDIAEMRHSIIRMSEAFQQMSDAFERVTKQLAVAIGDVYVQAPSICPDLNEDHYA